MLTHLPDTGMLQPRRLRARAGGLAGRPVVRPGGLAPWGSFKGPGLLPCVLQVPGAKEIQMGLSPAPPTPSCSPEVSEGHCLRHTSPWVAGRILRKPPGFSAPACSPGCTPRTLPEAENATDFTPMSRLCYKLPLTLRKGDDPPGPDLITSTL